MGGLLIVQILGLFVSLKRIWPVIRSSLRISKSHSSTKQSWWVDVRYFVVRFYRFVVVVDRCRQVISPVSGYIHHGRTSKVWVGWEIKRTTRELAISTCMQQRRTFSVWSSRIHAGPFCLAPSPVAKRSQITTIVRFSTCTSSINFTRSYMCGLWLNSILR